MDFAKNTIDVAYNGLNYATIAPIIHLIITYYD